MTYINEKLPNQLLLLCWTCYVLSIRIGIFCTVSSNWYFLSSSS